MIIGKNEWTSVQKLCMNKYKSYMNHIKIISFVAFQVLNEWMIFNFLNPHGTCKIHQNTIIMFCTPTNWRLATCRCHGQYLTPRLVQANQSMSSRASSYNPTPSKHALPTQQLASTHARTNHTVASKHASATVRKSIYLGCDGRGRGRPYYRRQRYCREKS
jgi:hypothetical protein